MAKHNHFEAEARARKVAAIVQAIDAQSREHGVDPDANAARIAIELQALTEHGWREILAAAGIAKASAETRRQVRLRFTVRAQENGAFAPVRGVA